MPNNIEFNRDSDAVSTMLPWQYKTHIDMYKELIEKYTQEILVKMYKNPKLPKDVFVQHSNMNSEIDKGAYKWEVHETNASQILDPFKEYLDKESNASLRRTVVGMDCAEAPNEDSNMNDYIIMKSRRTGKSWTNGVRLCPQIKSENEQPFVIGNDYWDILNKDASKMFKRNLRRTAVVEFYETAQIEGESTVVFNGISFKTGNLEARIEMTNEDTVESIEKKLEGTLGIKSITIR